MSRKPKRTTDRTGQVRERELARIISHARRSSNGTPSDAEVAGELLQRFTITPKGVGAPTPQLAAIEDQVECQCSNHCLTNGMYFADCPRHVHLPAIHQILTKGVGTPTPQPEQEHTP